MTRVASRTHVAVTLGKITAPPPPPPLRMAIELTSPVADHLAAFVATNRARPSVPMVQPGAGRGKVLALCGAGPSLQSATFDGADHLWACNSALPYLVGRGVRVDVAVGVDQSPGLLREWQSAPNVPAYYVATSCDPALIDHLLAHGRHVEYVHNLVGFTDSPEAELAYYKAHFPKPAFCLSEGMTVTSRVIGLAMYAGYERIDVYGADCAFAADDQAHANGESARQAYGAPLVMEGVIDGRTWRTRPDMLMDAVHLVRRVRQQQGRVRLMGDTLPVALLDKDEAFLDYVCRKLAPGEVPPDATTAESLARHHVASRLLTPLT